MKKIFKRATTALLLAAIIMTNLCLCANAAQPTVTITLDGQVIGIAAYVDSNNRTQASTAIAETLGMSVSTKGASVTYTKDGISVTFEGNKAGETVMDTQTVEGYVPIAYLAPKFGYDVQWDGASRTVILTSANYAYHQGIEQNTRYGRVSGFEKDGALHWFGIPYAKAPAGNLRWKAPQPLEAWDGVLEVTKSLSASQIGNVTVTNNGVQESVRGLVGSEAGAVTLDVTRPNTDETGLPIFFYIHGGNNQTDSSASFPATQFVQEANCVVVSVNLRLGLLGFNALPALKHGTPEENSGNFALLDLAAALDWVRENAGSFGGDSENITVTGSSAGGRDVMAMLISPIFEGKFQKAIAYSGGLTVADVKDSQLVEARALAPLAVKKGVQASEAAAAKWLLTDSDEVREFLYGLSDEELAAAFGDASIRMSAFPHLFADGVVLPKEGFDTKNYFEVPVMMVTGASEFSLFAKNSAPFSEHSYAEIMADEDLLAQYRFAETYGSMMYGYFNAEESAVKMFPNYKAPIYTALIQWGEDPAVMGEEYATMSGSYHCMSIPLMTRVIAYAFYGYPEQYALPSREHMSTMLNGYYKNFLWTGDPNGDELPQWNSWSSLTGTTQLVVDANDDGAWAKMVSEHTTYDDIFAQMDADNSIPDDQKDNIIQTVLNGRWFSSPLDAHYNNENLWK